MALTADLLWQLNDEYLSVSASSDEPELSHAERLQLAKESVYALMCTICRLGREGRRILRDDELRIAAFNDVRFRDSDRHARDVDNLEYWENKERYFKDQFDTLHDKIYPPPPRPKVLSPAERTRRLVEAWASSVENVVPSRPPSLSPPPSQHPVASPCNKVDHVSLSSPSSMPIAIPDRHERRCTKRKRSYGDDGDEDSQPPQKRVKLLQVVEATKVVSCATNDRPLPRRSARIAALPKKKYGR